MEFIKAELEEYCLKHSDPVAKVLQDLERETHLKVLRPRMLSGQLQSHVLRWIANMSGAQNILEIGTYTGYSAISFALSKTDNVKVYTIDINPELESIVRKYIHLAGCGDQITYLIGNALDIIPDLEICFDLVFIDADKENYLRYYELVLPKIKKGGIIIADNVLWSGKVIEEIKNGDIETQAIQKFNDFVAIDKRVEKMMLPIRDGLLIIKVL